MSAEPPIPRFHFRPDPPNLWNILREGVRDMARIIPETILTQPDYQIPGPPIGLAAPLVVADPELARQVLNDREGRFARDMFMRRLFRRAWGKGLAAAEGESWQNQRRAASPAFRPQAVESHAPAFAAAAAKVAGTLPLGEPIELTGVAGRTVAEVVFTTLVTGRGEVDTAAVAADMPAYARNIGRFGNLDYLPMPESWHDRMRGIPGNPAGRRIRALASRLAQSRGDGDFLSLLEGAGPIEDNLRGLFPAAMDTTVLATSWTLYLLALRPEWQARVAAEGRACGEDYRLEHLPLTRRVVQEALRLYPPAPFLARCAAAAGDLGGRRLQRGQIVIVCLYAMQRHRSLWDDPDAFDPDRFLPERGAHPAWLPFGFGPRVCVAAQFALAEIAAVTARLLSELELETAGPEPVVSLQVVTSSTTGLQVTARQRTA